MHRENRQTEMWRSDRSSLHGVALKWLGLLLSLLLSAAAIVANTLVTQRTESLIGLFVVGTGLPAYWIWLTSSRAQRRNSSR